ncbi:MAG: HlyD family efflux transporter periplasmic adaptor subunit [Planctomycetota bacterium]|nr:HlyD family efflux transporter periplasmic adaptor subunit [Planctomycetota bacterium]
MGTQAASSLPVGPVLPALRAVRSPRGMRKLGWALVVLFLTLPFVLWGLPWRQNLGGTGRVTAFEPLDRTQILPAPVSGRLAKLHVQEGERVAKGQLLAELEDQDPDFAFRLDQQVLFAQSKVDAARSAVSQYDQQLSFLEDARETAVSSAEADLRNAIQKVRAAEQDLVGVEAESEQKRTDRERKWTLFTKGVASELDFQKADAEAQAAVAKVESAKAKVNQARAEEEAKMATVDKIAAEQRAKIESTRASREEAVQKLQTAEKELLESRTKVERQKTQTVVAPRDGYVLRVHAANSADLLSQGDPLIELIPDTERLAAELWVRGNDAPLIAPGRKVRLQFEGWPAVQFAGWPSVAVGTFGGVVSFVDAQGAPDGRFRMLITPDPDDLPWPDRRYLRQGARATGWVLLDDVSVGYEIWRQLNAFPPSISRAPDSAPAKDSKSKSTKGEEK